MADKQDPRARKLASLQREVSRGGIALTERNELLAEMYEDGWLQRELVDAVNVGATKAGAAPISEGAVHKAISRFTRNGAR
jgi:hypothetical protein